MNKYKVEYRNYKGTRTIKVFICKDIETLYDLCFQAFGSQYANGCRLLEVETSIKKIKN